MSFVSKIHALREYCFLFRPSFLSGYGVKVSGPVVPFGVDPIEIPGFLRLCYSN